MIILSSKNNNDSGGVLKSGVPCLLVIQHSEETTNYAKIPSIWTSRYSGKKNVTMVVKNKNKRNVMDSWNSKNTTFLIQRACTF